jgi:hypothetical protein
LQSPEVADTATRLAHYDYCLKTVCERIVDLQDVYDGYIVWKEKRSQDEKVHGLCSSGGERDSVVASEAPAHDTRAAASAGHLDETPSITEHRWLTNHWSELGLRGVRGWL